MSETFVVCGDLHWRATNPQGRTDNFQEALAKKLREVFQIANSMFAKAVIIPGDIFDSPHVSLSTIGDLIEILSGREIPILCPILTVAGNHDEFAGNRESLNRTPYGLLKRLQVIHDVQDEPWYSSLVIVSGHGFDNFTDKDKTQYCPQEKPERGMIRIHVTHGMLLKNPPPFEMQHTLFSELEALPNLPDILINGHYHAGFNQVQWIGRTMIINPGALCRLSASVEEMERTVQVAVLTVNGSDDYQVETIPLQCARPGYEVLSREHIERQADREERINRFLSLLAAEGESKFLEVREIVADIARREALPEAVVKEALARIARAREELKITA